VNRAINTPMGGYAGHADRQQQQQMQLACWQTCLVCFRYIQVQRGCTCTCQPYWLLLRLPVPAVILCYNNVVQVLTWRMRVLTQTCRRRC
jgi:hypothetical protein